MHRGKGARQDSILPYTTPRLGPLLFANIDEEQDLFLTPRDSWYYREACHQAAGEAELAWGAQEFNSQEGP